MTILRCQKSASSFVVVVVVLVLVVGKKTSIKLGW